MKKEKTKLPKFFILRVVSMAANSFGLYGDNFPFTCGALSKNKPKKIIQLN
jgi:hypothetical protein